MFISEFGACLESDACSEEITSVTALCDEQMIGWAYWQFKNYKDLTTVAGTGAEGFYNPDGTLE